VRKIARERNVDLREVRGTGLEGRITKDDVLQYLAQRDAARVEAPLPPAGSAAPETAAPPVSPAAAAPSAPPELPRFIGETETVPMTPMRKAIAEHMVLSKRTSAHVNTFFEVDMTPVVALREKQKAEFLKREGIPLTYTPFFAKALVDVVREFPIFNASVSGDTIVYKKPIHLGIAVALESGLIVPVIRNAHLKSFTGIALSIHDLAERARTKRLKPEDVQNGTISMTNPGSYGGLFATPIISQPQVAILGVGTIEKRPVVIQDAIAIRSMVYLSLTFDHRVIDGAVADQFMARLKERLQGWSQWID
jgi:2-oxoglutarate dehydrogenase E2 component (dihydrolipoamide succinyltransferase)